MSNHSVPITDRRLPGEPPESHDPGEAIHWLRAYEDLLSVKWRLLQRALHLRNHAQLEDVRAELEQRDMSTLHLEASWLSRRAGFWRHRAAALGRARD